MRTCCILLLLVAMAQLWGCATVPYGIYEDKRMISTMGSDKAIATDVKTTIMGKDFSSGWKISVFCYYGKVYLVGEIPTDMHATAEKIARSRKGVRSVTCHWFSPKTGENSDLALATKLRTNLIATKKLSSTRIDTEVNSNRVVLLGVVNDTSEKDLAIKTARMTEGVKSVRSYLMLPQ